MYISNISIENIRCFEEINLSFEKQDGEPFHWNMVVGDNSTGKTCLLRCIAIGLCDEASGAALMKELEGDFLRKKAPKRKGKIEVTVKDDLNRFSFVITTEIYREYGAEKIKQTYKPPHSKKLINKIFLCGYGVQRAGSNDVSFRKYSALEAVYSLFRYDASLQDPELIIRRRGAKNRKAIFKKLEKVLMLDSLSESRKPHIRLVRNGVVAEGPWGKMLLSEMSDGYWSTFCWMVDHIGWQSYFKPNISIESDDLRGIVLLDELELHLHPNWQRFIVQRIKVQFPKVQFITTTHSPLTAAGVSDIDRDAQLIALKMQKGKIVTDQSLPSLRGMRADQVLTSEVFGLPTSISGLIGAKMARFRELFLKKRLSNDEKLELTLLRKSLSELPEFGETEQDRKIQREIKRLLFELEKMGRK